MFATSAKRGLKTYHLDIESAFLHGILETPVYMMQPEGHVDAEHPTKVCKLIKAIYGLKQGGNVWHSRFDSFLLSFGLKKVDPRPLSILLYIREFMSVRPDPC